MSADGPSIADTGEMDADAGGAHKAPASRQTAIPRETLTRRPKLRGPNRPEVGLSRDDHNSALRGRESAPVAAGGTCFAVPPSPSKESRPVNRIRPLVLALAAAALVPAASA